MMSTVSIWTRLGNWLRWSQGIEAGTGEVDPGERGPVAADELTVVNEPVPATEPADQSSGLSPLGRWHRREQVLQRLQEGYDRVVELLISVRAHLDAHDERTRQINASLSRLAETVREWPAASERHTEALNSLARQIAEQGEKQSRLADGLAEWTETMRQQADSIEQVHEEVRAGRQAQGEAASSIESLGAGVSGLTEATRSGRHLLESLDRKIDSQPDRVLRGFKSQIDRLRQLLWVTLGLAALAAVAAAGAVALHFVSRG